jgi:hypothetical protein
MIPGNDDLLQEALAKGPLHTQKNILENSGNSEFMNFPIFSKFTKKKFTKLTWGQP